MSKKRIWSKEEKQKIFAPLQDWEDGQRALWFFLGGIFGIFVSLIYNFLTVK